MITRKQLDDAIWKFMEDNKNYLRHRPALIILHPETRWLFTKDIFNDMHIYSENRGAGTLQSYMGIKVYGSDDVEKDKIELF